jgi:ABC-type molybdate transport system substrate-binding protein
MRPGRRHPGFLSSAWLVACVSLLVVVGLSILLWSPWDRPGIAGGQRLRLYCAAGLQKPVAEVIQKYAGAYDVTVEPTYGGSGELLATLRAAGGAGDLYLAADALNMETARKSVLVAETIPVVVMRPVLVVHKDTQKRLRAAGRPVTAAADLLRKDLKVILAHETGTSIGRLGRRVLEPLGIWKALEERRKDGSGLVSTAGTVNKVAVTVATGDSYVGVAWDAVARGFPALEIIEAPEFKDVSETVQVGVLAHSRQPTAALQFARYLTARDRGEQVFARHQFTTIPDADVWAEYPEIRLAAGAMLMPAVADVIKAFEQREGVEVKTTYAGCGILVAQMKTIKGGRNPGTFPDAYFACDATFLQDVQQWFGPGLTVARNDIVLIVPKGNPKNIAALADLARPDLRVGLAHPAKSAIGKLTDDLLERTNGLYAKVYAPGWVRRIIHGDAAHDLVNKLLVGALDVAVVYRSNALATPQNERTRLDVIALDLPGARATQPFAIAAETRHPHLLRRLRDALVAESSARRFRSLGFDWAYSPK